MSLCSLIINFQSDFIQFLKNRYYICSYSTVFELNQTGMEHFVSLIKMSIKTLLLIKLNIIKDEFYESN